MVVLPVFAEQAHNGYVLKEAGIAELLNKVTLTKEGVLLTIEKIMSNQLFYKTNIARARDLLLDRVIPSLDEAVFHTNRVLRQSQKQFSFFKSRGIGISWMAWAHLDSITPCFFLLYAIARK
jgi:hypothetical protein